MSVDWNNVISQINRTKTRDEVKAIKENLGEAWKTAPQAIKSLHYQMLVDWGRDIRFAVAEKVHSDDMAWHKPPTEPKLYTVLKFYGPRMRRDAWDRSYPFPHASELYSITLDDEELVWWTRILADRGIEITDRETHRDARWEERDAAEARAEKLYPEMERRERFQIAKRMLVFGESRVLPKSAETELF